MHRKLIEAFSLFREAVAATAGCLVIAVVATACTSANGSREQTPSPPASATYTSPTNRPTTAPTSVKPLVVPAVAGVSVVGSFDDAPTINVDPQGKPPANTEVSVVVRGPGVPLREGDLAVVDDVGRTWRSSTTFEDSYVMGHAPDTFPVGSSPLTLPGLVHALVGVPVGSRVLVVIPPNEGFGVSQSRPSTVSPNDTAVIVFDVIGSYAKDAGAHGTSVSSGGGGLPTVSGPLNAEPAITIPKNVAPPTSLSVTTLVQGDGPAVKQGQLVIVQYVGEIWASGKVFDSSWRRQLPAPVPIGDGALIPAWDTGLVGVKAGSRVLIVAPPGQGYGSSGAPRAGITATDTLVFVVDVLGAYNM